MKAAVFQADMAQFNVKGPKFDGAFCTVDTFRHLLTDADAINHLRNVARHIRKNSIYVLGLHLLPKSGISQKVHRWCGARGKLKVHSNITVLDINRRRREETLRYTLRVGKQKYQSVYKLRTYTLEQFRNLLGAAGKFQITSVHNLDYDPEQSLKLTQKTEEAVFILRRI